MAVRDEHIQVLHKAFYILEILAQTEGTLGISELARKSDMSKSTVYRILATLKELGYAEQNHAGQYTIGAKMFETLSYHINSLDLQTESQPYLAELRKELDLTTHLGVLDGPYVVYIEKISLFPGKRLYTQVGYRSPAYCSSMGKCLLASLSGDKLEEILYPCTFEKFTEHTYTQKKDFKACLRQVRLQGWAMDDEEYQLGHRCVGAPVFDYRGDVIAAISASGTKEEFADSRLESIIFHVKKAAREISQRMGYTEK